MGYIEKNLLKGEVVVYRATLHWFIYVPAIIWAIFSVLAFMSINQNVHLFGVIFAAFAIFSLIDAVFKQIGADYAITNKRLILKSGLISRTTVELMLTKCEGVSVDQGILGRIFGFGTLITTTGGATNRFRKIKDPVSFRNQINAQIDEAQGTK